MAYVEYLNGVRVIYPEDTCENTNLCFIELQFNGTYAAKPLPKVDLV